MKQSNRVDTRDCGLVAPRGNADGITGNSSEETAEVIRNETESPARDARAGARRDAIA